MQSNTMTGVSIQMALNEALRYFLVDSISSPSLLKHFSSGIFLRPNVFIRVARTFDHPELLDLVERTTNNPISIRAFAERLSQAYIQWESYIMDFNGQPMKLPKGVNYGMWLSRGGYRARYTPVHRLRILLHGKNDQPFRRAIVHGSVATLDDTPGFSDFDAAFIVRSSVIKNPRKLLELRNLAAEILNLTYAFDPFMHHGPYYISEIDLNWYPEAMFPPVLFSYGVDLVDNSEELENWIRPSDDVTDQMLDMFEDFFKNWLSNPFVLKDNYDLEWVLGSAMLLPALYLQRKTGHFRYKRDTFPLAEKDFSPEEWEPIKIASQVRSNLSPRPELPRMLVRVAQHLRWPGLLQRWARSHPISIRRAREAVVALGPDYPRRVLRLLMAMREKLPKR